MNILLLTADAGHMSVALVIARGETNCALEGQIVAAGNTVLVQLGEPHGQVLHQTELTAPAMLGAAVGAGAIDVLRWLSARNIRVDLVAHRIAHHAQYDHILRVALERIDPLAGVDASTSTVSSIEVIAAAYPALPQLVFFAARPHSGVSIADAITAAGWTPRPGARRN